MKADLPHARLFFIIAREAPVAVIFRRGPSKWVQIIKWNLETDEFIPGQWFHGRIYEKRCDLSPHGDLMIYFAQKINDRTLADTEYTYAWTAISKPPYLTALALWPKGDCWHGGGLFMSSNEVWLNHRPDSAKPHKNHQPPYTMKVIPNPDACGEDGPVYYRRLERDGWCMEQENEIEALPGMQGYRTVRPEIMCKNHPHASQKLCMETSITGYHLHSEFYVLNDNGVRASITDAECADWDHTGRLCYVGKGKVYAATISSESEVNSVELVDLDKHVHEEIVSPDWAHQWHTRTPEEIG